MITEKPNRDYWNVMKGIGIVLVVVGHTCMAVFNYIYLFHLPLFFFISGYLYSEEKYGDDPYGNFVNKIKTNWVKYVLVYWVFIFLHNVFYYLNMDINKIVLQSKPYNLFDIVYQMVNAVFGMGDEQMAGPLWFVPILVIGVVILGFIVSMSRKIYSVMNSKLLKYGFQFLLIAILGSAGYWIESHGLKVPANMQVAFICMPFYWVGYLFRNTSITWEKLLNLPCAIIAAVLVYIANLRYWLDLIFEVVYPSMHLVAFLGIYVSLYVGHVMTKYDSMNLLKKSFAYLGQASFTIMALHFVILRFIDLAYSNLSPNGNMTAFVEIPVAYSSRLWPLYLLAGLGIPTLVYYLIRQFSAKNSN